MKTTITLQAANYLDIKGLLDVTCKTIANMIKGKTPEEIRKTFNIKNDFTEEEKAQVCKENQWCEEKWNFVSNTVTLWGLFQILVALLCL